MYNIRVRFLYGNNSVGLISSDSLFIESDIEYLSEQLVKILIGGNLLSYSFVVISYIT